MHITYVCHTSLILLQEVPDPLVTLTVSNNPIRTRSIEYVPLLPSYPQTDVLGFTYVVDIRGAEDWKDTIEV
jgi:hypothetical protein